MKQALEEKNICFKKCGKCKEVKSINFFYRNATRKDGREPYCSDCCKDNLAKYKNKLALAEIQRRKRAKAPMKARARSYLQYALKAGKVKKEKCFFCGENETEGHHLLYEFKEKVVWLCRKHHGAVHLQSSLENK